jgi:transposase-like protein
MEKEFYNLMLSSLDGLTYQELVKIKEEIRKIDDRKKVANILEEQQYVTCGHCGSSSYVKYGRRNDLQRYKCKKCGKTFNQLTSTPLARLRKKGRWFVYSDCLNNGLTLRISSMFTGVAMSTAFRWRHRLLTNTQQLHPSSMNGVVESAETYFRYSEKGSRKPSELAVEVNKEAPKVYVFSNRDRNQNQTNEILMDFSPEKVSETQMLKIAKDILFVSDSREFYRSLAQKFNLRQGVLNLKKGELIKKQVVHLNNINDYFVRLHDWMKRFNGVATKYLVNYLGWFRELDEHNMKTPIETRLFRAKSIFSKPYQPIIEQNLP